MRLTQALGKGTGLLGFGGKRVDSGRDSRALLAHALGLAPDRIIIEHDREVSAAEMEAARAERFARGSGIPIEAPVVDMIDVNDSDRSGWAIATCWAIIPPIDAPTM